MRKPRALALLLLACFTFQYSRPAAAITQIKLPVPEIEKLPNGLEIAWFLSDTLPIVDLALLVKSGFRDDPVGKSGTAELTSNLLDRGAAGMTAQQIARAVEMLGGTRYAAADDDTFSIGIHGLASDAPALLDLLAKISLRPDFPEAEVKREKDRVLDQWAHIGDYGETLVGIAYRRLLSAGTVYGRGGFTGAKELEAVGRDDVVAFHRLHFTPGNSMLMVVGRVNKAEFKAKIASWFGDWKGSAPTHLKKVFSDKRLSYKTGEVVLVDRPNLTQAQVRIGFRAPLINSPDHYPLAVANALFGEYFNSRLNSEIRDQLALTYGIGSSFAYSKDLATFTISSATRNEMTGPLIRKTLDALEEIKDGPITEEEISTAKDYLVGGFPLANSTLGAVASRWLAGYIFDLGPNYLNEFVPRVSAVNQEQAQDAMERAVDLKHLVIVVAGDATEIAKSFGSPASLKICRKVTLKDLL